MATCVQYWKAANSKSQPTLWGHASRVPGRGWQGVAPPPFDPTDARAPAEFAGGGLAPRPSCRCVLSRAPHEGHMAAGKLLGSVEGTRTRRRTHEQSLRSEQPCRLTVEN